MVSSTFTDLQEHRAALIRAIKGQGLSDIAMENDSAKADVDVVASSLQMVQNSSAYCAVIGSRYGQTPECPVRNPDKLSITELEFNEAQRLGRPILVFIMGDDHPVRKADRETDIKSEKLNAFRENAKPMKPGTQANRVYATFNGAAEFATKATQAIADLRRFLDVQAQPAPPPQSTSEPNPAEPIWNIPPSDPNFFGRKEYIQNLRTALTKNNQPAALTQSIKGLGGLGKSKTALKYADLYRNEYTTGFWTVADSRDNLISGFASFAGLLNLPQREEKDITKAAAAAKRWFESNGNWLLILDNVDHWEVANDWIPTSKTGHVLITTQLQHTGNYAQGLELPRMTPDEGAKFLLERVKCDNPSAEDLATAKDISVEFEGLPLGLEQAGAYIDESKLSPAEYLKLYKGDGKTLRANGEQGTVTRTFTLALEKLGERAKEILRMAAFLAPDAIPEEMLIADGESPIEFRDAVTNAIRYSLIWRNPSTGTVSIHRLVQLVVKDTLDDEASKRWIERNAEAIAKCFPEEVEFNNWAACERLLPHAKILAADIVSLPIESKGSAYLLHQTAWYLGDRARYAEAKPLVHCALRIREQVLGPNHPDTATSLNNLAGNYRAQGQYKEAEPLYQRALEIKEAALGPNHPDTATSLGNLAGNYHEQGQYKEAEPLFQRALEIKETALGPNHPDTATSLGNLAGNYHEQGQYKEAEPLYKRALQIRETVLGPNHPDTAISLNNLAGLYASRGNFLRSIPLFARALAIYEKVHGTDHPDAIGIAKSYHNALQSLSRGHEAAKLRKKFKFNP